MTGMDMHASGEVNQTGPKTLIGKNPRESGFITKLVTCAC